ADAVPADAEPADAEPAEGPAPTDSANPAGGANPLRAGVDAADSAAGPAAPAADGAEPATPPSTPAADTPQSNGPDAAKPAEPEADAAGADAAAAIDPGAAADAPVEYLPLEEVTELIRNRLAQEKAVTALQQQLSEATAKLQSAYNQYGRAAVESRELKRKAPRPPAKLANLQWLADAYGLTYETTGALTYMQLNELPVGKAVDDQSGRVNLAAAAFTSLDLYEPFLAHDSLGGDWYLAAKIEDAPRRVPPFDEVRDKVAVAWRRIEAAKLAEKAAKDLAKELETSAEPFGEFFKAKGYEVVPQTAMFSWRTYLFGPENGQPAQLSDVPELKNVGPDFMEAAFSLKDGEKAIGLLNFDRSSAYVIRLAARQYTPDELKSLFLREANSWLGRPMMQRERSLTFRRSMQTHLAEEIAGFKFDEQWIERREKALAAERQ
ncbi:MAG TPA: hypothetical protein VEQ85_06295, partial [Lacipirellulaceae bacterium]|nr:hypothetical protein [Lacipirellulaceae bacterium]